MEIGNNDIRQNIVINNNKNQNKFEMNNIQVNDIKANRIIKKDVIQKTFVSMNLKQAQIIKTRYKNPNGLWQRFEDMGRFHLNADVVLGPFEGIKDCWKDQPVFVIGASSSLTGFDLNKLDGLNTIAINHMIEFYEKAKWLIFLDNRFLEKTTFELEYFEGKVFSSNTCQLLSKNIDNVRFKKRQDNDFDLNIENGLFNGSLTGLCALHLALITGASKIYLLGCDDSGQEDCKNYHFKTDKEYTGEIKTSAKYQKYLGARGYFQHFEKWADRVVNVCKDGSMPYFEKIGLDEFDDVLNEIKKDDKNYFIETKKQNKNLTICHVIKMENMQSMGSISRQIFDHSVGDHIWHNIDDPNVPFADIYLLECFINGAEKFLHFQRPYKNAKIISLIHSSSKCLPAICSDKVITVSNASNKMIKQAGFENTTIYASVNMEIFNKNIDYNNLNFGRITRYSRGKVHPKWDGIAIDILEKYKDSNCYMISNNYPEIKHDRFNIIRDVKINDDKMKAEHLSKLSLFVAMHNTFFETFNLCLLEAMSIGLPIILYSETKQSAMIEVLGDAGIICNTIDDFKYTIESFLINPNLKKEYGLKAKKRAEYFTVDKMIDHYNAVFLEVINGK